MEEAKKNLLTYAGLRKLEDELHDLKVVKRKEVAGKIKEAREQGDLSENAEYDAAKDEQRDIEARIEELEKILKNAEVVVEEEADLDKVSIGCSVKILDCEFDEELEYKIVEYYRSPYYENYSTFVSCSRNGNYLVKDITTEYTLKNPMAGKEKIEAIVGLDLFFCKNSNSTSPKLMEFTIQNENEEKKNILELSEMHETPINTEGAYNTKATIAHKSTVEKYKILLDKSTYVKLRYISYAPISDKSYISILRYPTKNYKMVFHNPKNDLSFSGDFIGPLLTDDHIMVNKKEGLINIDCTTWCLPGDGVTVAIFEKENADC